MIDTPPKKSDLGVRTLSAAVMLAVSGTALWLGGWWWTVFVAAAALGVLWEWWGLTCGITLKPVNRAFWNLLGFGYVGIAAFILSRLGFTYDNFLRGISLIGAVIATDIGAYFAGRTFGGPKIAPSISPSKTWSGLIGGMLGAAIAIGASGAAMRGTILCFEVEGSCTSNRDLMLEALVVGALIAIVAQTGDFFESWMKRRAGVKDSGNLIPGHGGLFDRVDGLLAVCFVIGLFMLAMRVLG